MAATPTAAEILHRAHTSYASFRSYRDEGEQTLVMTGSQLGPRGHKKRLHFRTAFVRPSNVFFEYRDVDERPESDWTHGIVCANEYGVVKWWSLGNVAETTGTLSNALGGFAGVSGRTSYVVPKMLLPELEDQLRLGPEVPWVVQGTGEFDGHVCDVIGPEAQTEGVSYSMWLDQASALLRRIDERKEFNAKLRQAMAESMRKHMESMPPDAPRDAIAQAVKQMEGGGGGDFSSTTTTIWRPQVNIDIDPEVFEFAHPRTS